MHQASPGAMSDRTAKPKADQRADLRQQLFRGKAKKANNRGEFKDLDEKAWFLPNWPIYVKLNYSCPDPGPDQALEELREMIDTGKTPDYKGGKKGGKANPIPPRPLSDKELDTLKSINFGCRIKLQQEKLRLGEWTSKQISLTD